MQATDGVMTYHDLQVVWPYGPIRLDSLTFLHQTGTHATLRLTGIVPEDKEEEIIHLASNHDGIGLYGKQGAAKKPIFMGCLQHVEIKVVRDIHYVTIQAISHTYAMDLSPKTRSFQQVDRLYRDVVEEALSVYPGGDFIDQAFDEKKQGKFIMQYEETDWTFVRRIASHVGAVLVPDVSDHKVRFWIGMPEGRKQIKLEAAPYEVNRAIAPYMKKAANGASSLSEYQYTTYTFDHDEWLHIGDEVQRDGRTFVITKVVGTLEQGLLKWTYVCAVPESVKQTKLYNSAIIGAAIDGKIIQVGRNQVKIHLNMDQKQDASKAQWFPYAAEGNQILYLMPELGSKVKLYFPGAEEDDGMVMNSVRHAPQGEAVQKQAKKMQDPGVKSFGNPQGKEFTLGDKELTMTAQEGMLYISMNQDAGVSFNSASQVRIQASGGLSLHGAAVTLTGSEGLSIKTIVDHMELQEEISASSEEIKLDATTRRSFPHLWSAFEEKVQSIGVDGIIKERIQANMDAEVRVTKEFWSENMSAFWAATVDTADIVFSTLSFGYSENVYEWASGKEVGSLTERNLMVQGLQKTAEDAFTYAEKVITGEKSKLEVAGDALDAGRGILKEAVEPFIEEAQYLIEDAKGGKWTRSIEESYEKGRNSAKKDLIILELVGSRGLFGAYRKAVKKVRDQGGSDSKASHTSDRSDHEQGQQKDGNGAALPLQGANDHHRNSTGQKDGKLKTKAEIPLDEIQNLQDVIDLLILKMNRKLDGRIVIGQTSADGIGGVGGYHVFFEADQRGRGGSKDKGGETRRTEGTGKENKSDLYDKNGKYTGGRTQEELDDLATDPDRGHVLDDQGKKEREVGLAVEERGDLGRIKRDSGGAEFYDELSPNKQRWDVKSYESYPNGHTDPKKGAFSVKTTLKNMYKKLNKGINIIIDTRQLIPEHIEQLKEAIVKEGLVDRVIWYP